MTGTLVAGINNMVFWGMTAQEWAVSATALSHSTQAKYHRWSSGWEDLYEAGNNRVAQLLARTQHTDANIIKVFHSTQIQRDKRISWQLVLPYLCPGANFFIFQSAMQIISHFIPNHHNSVLDKAHMQRAQVYLSSAKMRYWKENVQVRPHCPSRRTQIVHTQHNCVSS